MSSLNLNTPKRNRGRGKTIIIIILIILLLAALGYIFFGDTTEEPKKCETVVKEEKNKTISKEEALKIGKEKYLYVRDGLYHCGYKSVTLSNEKYDATALEVKQDKKAIINQNGTYQKITNLADIKNTLTQSALNTWLNDPYVPIEPDNQGNYYITPTCEHNEQYKADKYQIEVDKIYENIITYKVKEYFCSANDITKCNTGTLSEYETTFELIKADNEWLINTYIDAAHYYDVSNQ